MMCDVSVPPGVLVGYAFPRKLRGKKKNCAHYEVRGGHKCASHVCPYAMFGSRSSLDLEQRQKSFFHPPTQRELSGEEYPMVMISDCSK